MLEWLKRGKSLPLAGAPLVRRRKTYSSQTGFVYEYVYQGQRPAVRGGESSREFVFEVSFDRTTTFPASVFVNDSAVAAWQEGHGRDLSGTECYAIAKMALFQAFDERPAPRDMKEEIRVRAADLEAILETLGIE
jgi:hypothetical protein